MKRQVICAIVAMWLCGTAHAEILTFRYYRQGQPPVEFFADTETDEAYMGAMSITRHFSGGTTTRTRVFRQTIPGNFPDPDIVIETPIRETITIEPYTLQLNILQSEPRPLVKRQYNNWEFPIPIAGEFTLSQYRGTYRAEGLTETYETSFATDFILDGYTRTAFGDFQITPQGRGYVDFSGVVTRFVPANPVLVSATVDGFPISYSVSSRRFVLPSPEPTGAVPMLLGFLAVYGRMRRRK